MTAITNLIPTGQSLAILANTFPSKKKKKKVVKTAVETIVGLSVMRETSKFI